MFGKPSLAKHYAGIIKQIEKGERLPPRHQRPGNIRDSGFESLATAAHDIFFRQFEWFAAVLNQHVANAWCVEELADTLIRDYETDSPELGRRYRVHYNACEMGTIQCFVAGMDRAFHPEKFVENPQAEALIDLNYLRFVPYGDAHSLLSTIAWFMGRFEDGEAARARASAEATAALTGHLWESVRMEDTVMDFRHRSRGSFELLRMTAADWKEGGIDPFEKWGGDRLRSER